MTPVEFYFDVASPYGFLAAMQLDRTNRQALLPSFPSWETSPVPTVETPFQDHLIALPIRKTAADGHP